MTIVIAPVRSQSIDDIETVFCDDKSADGCWCMWFTIPVKEYHAAGPEGNRASFRDLVESAEKPVGLVAYEDGQPVGWCAVGPRSRYKRAIKTPTYKGRDPFEDDQVWLVPCFYIRRELRQSGLTRQLLAAAVNLAKEYGATAIEGFPYTGARRRSKDTQVGFHSVFTTLGFRVVGTPSDQRVVVKLEF